MRRMFGFMIGIMVGALVGSTVALLLAPESGEALRKRAARTRREAWLQMFGTLRRRGSIELTDRLETLREPGSEQSTSAQTR